MKYFTTPIYYVNDKPHIGHAYTSIAADIFSRFFRIFGDDDNVEKSWKSHVKFLTGTDEHGQKVARSAEKNGLQPIEFCNQVSKKFFDLKEILNLSNDDFIRTTEERHIKSATKMWNILMENGYIYKSFYEGWYSQKDEAFVPDNEVVDGFDKDGNKLEFLKEESYFFKLSEFGDRLLKFYDQNPDFISPNFYMNEVVSFVKSGLKDLSISRTSFSWGIKVPNDEKHVMYVWLDALCNYISAIGFGEDDDFKSLVGFDEDLWKNSYHLLGKDILKFHAVYWPAFLMAAGMMPPKKLYVHGWWTSEGKKMSKSLGNTVDPIEMVQNYGVDQFRYFLFKESNFGFDCNFSTQGFKNRINFELCNDFGNLVQRVLVLASKNSDESGNFRLNYNFSDEDLKFREKYSNVRKNLVNMMEKGQLTEYLNYIFSMIGDANKYVDQEKPWELLKKDETRFQVVISNLISAIIHFSVYLTPYMPSTCRKVLEFLNFEDISEKLLHETFSTIKINKPTPIFQKID